MRNKKLRRIGAVLVALIMALAMSATAFGSTGTSDALNIALKNAKLSKSEVKVTELEKEGKTIEVSFIKLRNKARYDYEISAKDGRIFEKSIEYRYTKTSSKYTIGKTKARKIAARFSGKSYDTVAKGTCRYEYENKFGKYEVKFRSGSYKYECDIVAKNGNIIEYEYEYTGTR